jgi:hypothetical protein
MADALAALCAFLMWLAVLAIPFLAIAVFD